MQFQRFTPQIKYNSPRTKNTKRSKKPAKHAVSILPTTTKFTAVGRRIPPTPFVERESTSANVFSKMTRRDETLV